MAPRVPDAGAVFVLGVLAILSDELVLLSQIIVLVGVTSIGRPSRGSTPRL